MERKGPPTKADGREVHMNQLTTNAEAITATRSTAVSYLRVSTKEQAERDGDPEGYSLPAQREANQRKAESLGADIVEEFIDRGESARSSDRPDLQRMLTFIAENPVDYVIVHKVDRLARNRADDVTINLAIQKANARLVSVSENIDETPSGMLLHGIMSSIAEFYSRNLSTEVVKGMSQKAKTGGTPGRAPIGYLNRAVINEDGREVRTVVLDEQRAHLISWAFRTYAEGELTIRQLAEEVASRGLSSPATPTRPSRPVDATMLHKILSNPYYKGEVRFQGGVYPGRHQPLVTIATWQRVQDLMASRVLGEKIRKHHLYLKSSVFCGKCGSRLIVHMPKNRHGTVYEYYVCSGRHSKRNGCDQRALPVGLVENKVVELYKRLQLEPEARATVEKTLRLELERSAYESKRAHQELTRERARLQARSRKLLDAHLDGALPADMYKGEQRTISSQLAAVDERLERLSVLFEDLEKNLEAAIDLASNCYEAYRRAPDSLRRIYNQAFFKRILIWEEEVAEGELQELFEIVFTIAEEDSPSGSETRGEAENTGFSASQGSNEGTLVPLEGLEPPTLSLGRSCSSIELQRQVRRVYPASAAAAARRGRERAARRLR